MTSWPRTNVFHGLRAVFPESVLSQEVDGEVVLLDVRSGQYYGLNPVGSRIWMLLQEHGDLEEVVRRMLAEYDVPEERLREDMARHLLQLQKRGLIDVRRTEDR